MAVIIKWLAHQVCTGKRVEDVDLFGPMIEGGGCSAFERMSVSASDAAYDFAAVSEAHLR